MAATGEPSVPAPATLSSPSSGTPSSPALPSDNIIAAAGAASGAPLSHAIQSISIKSLVPYTLDLQAHNYTKWRTPFCMVLGRFNLLHHVESDDTHPDNLEWTKDNLLVGNWLYSTISENLLDMCAFSFTALLLAASGCTFAASSPATNPAVLFTLRVNLYNLVQGDISAHDCCHLLQQLPTLLPTVMRLSTIGLWCIS
jgi:hypothetical protein